MWLRVKLRNLKSGVEQCLMVQCWTIMTTATLTKVENEVTMQIHHSTGRRKGRTSGQAATAMPTLKMMVPRPCLARHSHEWKKTGIKKKYCSYEPPPLAAIGDFLPAPSSRPMFLPGDLALSPCVLPSLDGRGQRHASLRASAGPMTSVTCPPSVHGRTKRRLPFPNLTHGAPAWLELGSGNHDPLIQVGLLTKTRRYRGSFLVLRSVLPPAQRVFDAWPLAKALNIRLIRLPICRVTVADVFRFISCKLTCWGDSARRIRSPPNCLQPDWPPLTDRHSRFPAPWTLPEGRSHTSPNCCAKAPAEERKTRVVPLSTTSELPMLSWLELA
ncbi:hypothetical protein VTI74DRAFT_4024 [Chaetomium olivicolor]